MNVKVEKIEKNVVQLDFEVEASVFDEGLQKSYFKNVKRFNIPGFRKGKAPRHIVERYYGEEILYEDAANFVFSQVYQEAIEENNLKPVDEPNIDIKQIGKGQNFIFNAKVTVTPEFELGEYIGIEVPKIDSEVTEEDLNEEIKKIASKNARIVTIEDRPIQKDDTTYIDFEGFIDDVAFEGGKGTDYALKIGSGQFIQGFEDQLIGSNIGDEIDVHVTFPEEYHSAELSGKPALFKVKINKATEEQLPEIDDEFAKDVSEFDTLEEYKQDLMNKLKEDAKNKSRQQLEDAVLNKLIEATEIEIPRVMIEKTINRLVYDFNLMLNYQGVNIEQYISMMGTNMNDFRKQFEEKAIKEVKLELIMEKIRSNEKIEVSQDEIEEKFVEYAKRYNQTVEEFRNKSTDEFIHIVEDSIAFKKVVDLLIEKAKLV